MHIQHELDKTSDLTQYYYTALYEKVANLVDTGCEQLGLTSETVTVLDIGCGRGENLKNLKKRGYKNLLGIDFDPKCVELSSHYADTFLCDVTEVTELAKGKSIDITIASHVMEHVHNPKQFLQDIGKIPTKLLLIAVPNLGNPMKSRRHVETVNDGHLCGWDAAHLKTLLHGSGFEVIKWERDMFLLPEKIRSIRLRSILPNFIVNFLEVKLLPAIHPFVFTHSLICLSKKV